MAGRGSQPGPVPGLSLCTPRRQLQRPSRGAEGGAVDAITALPAWPRAIKGCWDTLLSCLRAKTKPGHWEVGAACSGQARLGSASCVLGPGGAGRGWSISSPAGWPCDPKVPRLSQTGSASPLLLP